MNSRLGSILALLVVFAAALYVPRRENNTTNLSGDEVFAALTAQSVASTGRDLNGRFLPLYFQMPRPFRSEMWFQPIPVYSMAATLKALPLSEGTIRLPMAIFGVIDIVLIYLVGKQLFRRESLAIGGAALLGLTPAHFAYSRTALDFQAHLPFILGWLLCLVIYLRGNRRAWLFGAGLMLGIGLYTYIAAYMLMPLYALLTCGILYARREPLNRFVALGAGFMLPASLGLIFLLRHSTVAVGMFMHYQRDEGVFISALEPSRDFAIFRRLAGYGGIYLSFWIPRLLFIHGPRSTTEGLFLLPVAGLFVAVLVRLVTRPTLELLLLIGGLVGAPLPASMAPQAEVIHRVTAMLPFGALLAMMGLEYVWAAETARARALAFAAVWGSIISLAVIYHDDLRNAQAIVRAATVPLAVTGLAVLMRHFEIDWGRFRQIAGVALVTLIALQIAYLVVDYETVMSTSVVLLATISAAPLLPGLFDRLSRRPLLVVASLAVISSMFIHMYVEHTNLPWVPRVHAFTMFMAVRFLAASTALAAVLWIARRVTTDRLSRARVPVAILVLTVTQLAYFYIDYFPDFPLRFIQATAVLVGAVGLARLRRSHVAGRLTLGQIAAAALFALASIQFAQYYVGSVVRNTSHRPNAEALGQRVAFETALERAQNRVVPAVYLANLGVFGEKYWRFYALKHHRPDLVPRTISDEEFAPNRIADLSAGSIAVVGHSIEADKTINRMMAGGQLTGDALNAQDGTSLFWILERRDR